MNLAGAGSGYLGPALVTATDTQELGRIVFEKYDKDRGGQLGATELAQMMIEMYRSMNKAFTPTKADVESFARALDLNRDGMVDLRDVERVADKTMKVDVVWEARKASVISTKRPSMMVTQSMLAEVNK